MANEINNQEWLNEYSNFLSAEETEAPKRLNAAIREIIDKDLNPNPWSVFSKVALVQVVVGFVTLLFCPQFGFSPTGAMGLMSVLMNYGMGFCMAGCGSLFLGSSLLVSSLILKSDEVRVLRSHSLLQISLMSLLAVGTFLCLGAEVFEVLTLAWIGGSLVGGFVSLELGWHLRQWIKNRVVYG